MYALRCCAWLHSIKRKAKANTAFFVCRCILLPSSRCSVFNRQLQDLSYCYHYIMCTRSRSTIARAFWQCVSIARMIQSNPPSTAGPAEKWGQKRRFPCHRVYWIGGSARSRRLSVISLETFSICAVNTHKKEEKRVRSTHSFHRRIPHSATTL